MWNNMSYTDDLFVCLANRLLKKHGAMKDLEIKNKTLSLLVNRKDANYDTDFFFKIKKPPNSSGNVLAKVTHKKNFPTLYSEWEAGVFEKELEKIKPNICEIKKERDGNIYEFKVECGLEDTVRLQEDPKETCDVLASKDNEKCTSSNLSQKVWEQGIDKFGYLRDESKITDIRYRYTKNIGCSRKNDVWKCSITYKEDFQKDNENIYVETLKFDNIDLSKVDKDEIISRKEDDNSFMVTFDKKAKCLVEEFLGLRNLRCY